MSEIEQLRATLARVKALVELWEDVGSGTNDLAEVRSAALRAALNAPTEQAPNLVVPPDAPTTEQDGYGTWLADRGLTAHDPPKVDPLAASKARIEKVMKGMA